MTPPLSVLQLAILPNCDEIYIQFLVDGRDLGEMVKRLAGSDSEFFGDNILPFSGEDTVLGKRARTQGMQGAILFACGCGQIACSCVLADVSVNDANITLQNFRTYRDRTSALAPITFTRTNYEAALSDLERQVANWKPPAPAPPKPRIPIAKPPDPEIHPEQEC